MPKIVLSSVHGSAAGAGMGLAFVTDLCIAAEDAKFTPAYAKIGVSPDGGSTVGMVGTVGVRRALQIFLAEDTFSAQQAYDWGLVAKVVPAAELKAATRQFAERLAQNLRAAEIIAAAASKIVTIDHGLIELDFGSFEGMPVRETMMQHGANSAQGLVDMLPADAEPWSDVVRRALASVGQWLDRHPQDEI